MHSRIHHALSLAPARFASTSSASPFPYPAHPNPKPHEIFHLSGTASQPEIKARCEFPQLPKRQKLTVTADIDLVRAHHPDSAQCRHLPAHERHARFQAVAAAYDHLRGRGNRNDSAFRAHAGDKAAYEDMLRRRRHRGRADTAPNNDADVSLELLPIVIALSLAAGGVLSIMTRDRDHGLESPAYHLAEARREAQEHGQERRRAIRREARKYQLAKDEQERYANNSCQSVVPGAPKVE
ncbi:hypothetical protein HWV62_24197 [Athelia sp. TMB]|nr:hypothetical protein HWV62_24197 [Athelia sp. TMB]